MTSELVEDPILRQRYRFTREGDVLWVEIWADPGASAPEHFHPVQREDWELLEGEAEFRIDGRTRSASPGERLAVEPGVRHAFENVGQGVARLRARVEPALDLQEFLTEGAALNASGRFTRGGLPKGPRALLEGADFTERYRATIVLTSPPVAVQRLVVPPLARLARRRRARANA
jgi:hypothetical protein